MIYGIGLGIALAHSSLAENSSLVQTNPNNPMSRLAIAEGMGATPTATVEERYEINHPLQDFGVHFFISLPFTALYSYFAVTSLDSVVQGRFFPELRAADTWVIIGLAVGGSLAIALGSMNRVPDQTNFLSTTPNDSSRFENAKKTVSLARMELMRLTY